MKDLIKKNVQNLGVYKVGREPYDVKLDANENPYNVLEELTELITSRLVSENLNRYPDNDALMLREAIATYIGVKDENIICGNGSDEIIKMIVDAFVDKDDVVVTHTPTFSMYKVAAEISGGRVIEIEDNEDFEINIENIINAANENNAKVIFLCNPNNPTGILIGQSDIIRVLESTNAIVAIDEAYYEFCGETVVDKIDKYDRLIVLRTLSKAFGLAGMRVGYGVANSDFINVLNKVRPPYNLNTVSQAIGEVVLQNMGIVDKYIEEIKREREFFMNELSSIKDIKVIPSKSNFLLIKTDKYLDLIERFKENKIKVRDFGSDGILKNCIRLTVGTREENKKALKVIKEV
ncbi:MAG: histidinol-phosphate aminotransferase [Candidatus Petromonas sp.]|jgi:histidinol-phosphate aminotransferase|nr:histidinol-phosphate aminotransferase [Candidatus Petromonas sp.]